MPHLKIGKLVEIRHHFSHFPFFHQNMTLRLNQKYRLEMEIAWENEAQTIGKFYLQTISNHYDG